jgi:catechol 2,3-dioxygenase-like lactoylglutathione lyase family enzyme
MFHHVGISVGDLDAAVAWYERALGLETEFPFAIPGLRGAMLKSADGYRVELLERADSANGLTGAQPNEALLTRGYGHFAIAVDDLDSCYERLLADGADGVWDPRPSPEPGVRMAFVHDPEGNLIELLERGA